MSASGATEEYYELLAHGRAARPFASGEVVFSQGDPGDSMFVVRTGTVPLRDGERLVEQVAAPGLFGEMALIENEPRSLTAVAASDSELIEIPARHFWILVHETPHFAQLVMRVMAHRLRRAGGST